METTNQEVPVTNQIPVTPEIPPTGAGVPPTTPVAPVTPAKKNFLTSFLKLPLKIKIAVIAAIILVFMVLVMLLFRPNPQQVVIVPSPTPVTLVQPSFSPLPRVTSEFAKTENFAKFEANIKQLKDDNKALDLDEVQLTFPLLDWAIMVDSGN